MNPACEVNESAAPEVLEINRATLEALRSELGKAAPASALIGDLDTALAAPKVELWAVVGPVPGEVWPALDRDHAVFVAQDMARRAQEVLAKEGIAFDVQHHVVPSPWSPAEHFEVLAHQMVAEAENFRQAAIRATQARDQARLAAGQAVPA